MRWRKCTLQIVTRNQGQTIAGQSLATGFPSIRLIPMNAPVDIELIKGRQRSEDTRRLAAGEITPEELQRENSFIWSASDILHVDLMPKGTEESWARIIR